MFAKCEECGEIVEVGRRLPDGPDFCSECRSVDSLDFDFEEED